ncbi:uncharacterized protein BDR25DRAFT_234306, partial [Lindgomyces ingoldianus]
KEKDNYTLVIKLYVDSVIITPRKLFKELDYIEIKSLIIGSMFKVLLYNLLVYKGQIFNFYLIYKVKRKLTQLYKKLRLVFIKHFNKKKKKILT